MWDDYKHAVMNDGVILSIANINHYYYTALALQRAGILKRLICSLGLSLNNKFRYLPARIKNRLSNRSYNEIDPSMIKRIPWVELIPRGFKEIGLISSERNNWLFSHAYDRASKQYLAPCDFFHFVAPAGISSGELAKKQGSVVLADVRTEYINYQYNLLLEENDLWGFKSPPLGTMTRKISIAAYQIADYLIVPSSYAKRTFIDAGFKESRVITIPYGVDTNKFVPSGDISDFSQSRTQPIYRIVFVGSISPRKGVHYLVEAFVKLNLADSELILIGSVHPDMGPFISKNINMNSGIRVIKQIPHEELPGYFANASVFVLPSLADSFGLVCLEAMACGIPVIATENTGSKDFIREGIDGFITPIRDVEALAEKLTWLYDHPEQRLEMGRNARKQAHNNTWENYENRIIQMYNKLYELRGQVG